MTRKDWVVGIALGVLAALTVWGVAHVVGRVASAAVITFEDGSRSDGTCIAGMPCDDTLDSHADTRDNETTDETPACAPWLTYPDGSTCDATAYGHGTDTGGSYVMCPDGVKRYGWKHWTVDRC